MLDSRSFDRRVARIFFFFSCASSYYIPHLNRRWQRWPGPFGAFYKCRLSMIKGVWPRIINGKIKITKQQQQDITTLYHQTSMGSPHRCHLFCWLLWWGCFSEFWSGPDETKYRKTLHDYGKADDIKLQTPCVKGLVWIEKETENFVVS